MKKLKSFLFISLFILVQQTIIAQSIHRDVNHDDFLGKVKTCLQVVFNSSVTTPRTLAQAGLKTLTYYDLIGNRTKIITYDETGKEVNTTSYQYNNLGLKTGYSNSRGTNPDKITYESDAANHIIQKISYRSGGFLTRKLDEGNRILEASIFASNNQLIQTSVYQYDKSGHQTDSKTFKGGIQIAAEKLSYDERHQLLKMERYNLSGDKLIVNTVVYFDKGNMIKELYYDLKGKVTRQNDYVYLKYDSKGNWTECNENANGKLDKIYKREFTYY